MAEQKRTYIKAWRLKRELTQEQLADKIGRTISYVSELESDAKRYNRDVLEEIASALGVDPWQLLGDNPDAGETAEVVRIYKKLKPGSPTRKAWIDMGRSLTEDDNEEAG